MSICGITIHALKKHVPPTTTRTRVFDFSIIAIVLHYPLVYYVSMGVKEKQSSPSFFRGI
jgi:hypothetical protein